MQGSRRLLIVGVMLSGAGLGGALAAAPPAVGGSCPPASATLAAEGSSVFNDTGTCFTCHGSNGIGTPLAPELMAGHTWIQIGGSYGEIAELVKNGVPHPKEHPAPMPPMGGMNLTQEELCAVSAYVVSITRPASSSQ